MGEQPSHAGAQQHAAWRQIRHDILVKVALRILRDKDDAEDIVQDTLAKVWERSAEVRPRHLAGYLARAVEMNALNYRARRRRTVPLEEVDEFSTREMRGGDPPDAIQLDPATLERALIGLPPVQQAVLRMKFYVGLSFREIGTALSISQNTAASRYRYAISALRKALHSTQQQDGET